MEEACSGIMLYRKGRQHFPIGNYFWTTNLIGVVYDMIDCAYWDEMQHENLALCFGLCMGRGFG